MSQTWTLGLDRDALTPTILYYIATKSDNGNNKTEDIELKSRHQLSTQTHPTPNLAMTLRPRHWRAPDRPQYPDALAAILRCKVQEPIEPGGFVGFPTAEASRMVVNGLVPLWFLVKAWTMGGLNRFRGLVRLVMIVLGLGTNGNRDAEMGVKLGSTGANLESSMV